MENREDWRSAVDPASGKTYWYHRKTRVSTWTKPTFIDEVSTSSSPVFETNIANEIMPTNQGGADMVDTNNYSTHRKQGSIKEQQVQQVATKHRRDQQDKSIVDRYPEGLARAAPDKDDVMLAHKVINITDELVKLDNDLLTQGPVYEDESFSMLSQLSSMVVGTSSPVQRQLALKCLWTLSVYKTYANRAFSGNSTWLDMCNMATQWKDGESIIILSAVMSNLIVGPTFETLDLQVVEYLMNRLNSILDSLTNEPKRQYHGIVMDNLRFLVDGDIFACFSHLAEFGHSLPAQILLILGYQSLRMEKIFASVVVAGIISAAQKIYASKALEQSLVKHAHALMLQLMNQSTFVRQKILDAFLCLSTQNNMLPMPTGPCPLLSSQWRQSEAQDLSLEDVEVVDLMGVEERALRDVIDRDILWIPRSGIAWSVTSTMLWCSCPALRDIIADFWERGASRLELSIDCSANALAAICRFIHSSTLQLPSVILDQLELLRLSHELGMEKLQVVAEEMMKQILSEKNVDAILESSELLSLSSLTAACMTFKQQGKAANLIRLQSCESDVSHSALKSAIYESLNDVSTLLNLESNSNGSHSEGPKNNGISGEKLRASIVQKGPSAKNLLNKDKIGHGSIYPLLLNGEEGRAIEVEGVRPLPTTKMPGKVLEQSTNPKNNAQLRKGQKNHSTPASQSARNVTTKNAAIQGTLPVGQLKGEPTEYRPEMSLEPQFQRSDAEQRLYEMSRPKQSREPNFKKKPSEENDLKPSVMTSKDDSREKTETLNARQKVDRSLSLSSMHPKNERWDTPPDTSVVRSSLVLLKNRTLKARRRSLFDENEESVYVSSNFTPSSDEHINFDTTVTIAEDPKLPANRKNSDNTYDGSEPNDLSEGESYRSEGRSQCKDCGRYFLEEALEKHAKICRKVFGRKRKVFDSSKMRIQAIPELKELKMRESNKKKMEHANGQSKSTTWKEKSMAFRAAMKAAKSFSSQDPGKAMPVNEPYIDPSFIECPNCLRRFNAKAADRHIPVCQSIKAKPGKLMKGSGTKYSPIKKN